MRWRYVDFKHAQQDSTLHFVQHLLLLIPVKCPPVQNNIPFLSAGHCIGAQAVAWLIDELKAKVPIWKKEVFEGGEVWKENAESRKLLSSNKSS